MHGRTTQGWRRGGSPASGAADHSPSEGNEPFDVLLRAEVCGMLNSGGRSHRGGHTVTLFTVRRPFPINIDDSLGVTGMCHATRTRPDVITQRHTVIEGSPHRDMTLMPQRLKRVRRCAAHLPLLCCPVIFLDRARDGMLQGKRPRGERLESARHRQRVSMCPGLGSWRGDCRKSQSPIVPDSKE
jgi:hypothetical protein